MRRTILAVGIALMAVATAAAEGAPRPAPETSESCRRPWRCGPYECGWRCAAYSWRSAWRSRYHNWRRHRWRGTIDETILK